MRGSQLAARSLRPGHHTWLTGTLLALALFAWAAVGSTKPVATVGAEGMRDAVAALQSGDDAKAVPILESNALAGDSRAQYLLGALYLTSKQLPVNKPLGFAWLELAADSAKSYGGWSSRQAAELMAKAAPVMTGEDLLEADRIAASLLARLAAESERVLLPVVKFYSAAPARSVNGQVRFDQPEVQISVPRSASNEPLVRIGCADVENTECPEHREATMPACTGRIVQAETAPSIQGGIARTNMPKFPVGARRDGNSGRAVVLMHVDASGWICSVALAGSTGDSALDLAALDGVRQWRVNPAIAGGKPVESLSAINIDYQLY